MNEYIKRIIENYRSCIRGSEELIEMWRTKISELYDKICNEEKRIGEFREVIRGWNQ